MGRITPKEPRVWYDIGIAYYCSGNSSADLDAVQKLHELFNVIVPR